ncbi:MAG: acyltransferase family protein, partial [Clostridia bacterium]|nr:acyltransferase family protein [Clostridia bacterium]
MSTRKAPRQANIELLRVVSMLAVIAMHFLGVGGVMTSSSGVWFVVASTFYSFAIAATSCYVLIGGYFLATSKFRTGRIFRLLLEFFTYTFGIYLLFGLAVYLKNGDNIFSLHEFLTFYLFPIVHEENWFVTCYILMLLMAPFYNILLQNLTKQQHLLLIVLTVFLFSVVPTVIWHAAGQFLQSGGYSFVWFSVLYFVAAYFRLYGVPEHLKSYQLLQKAGKEEYSLLLTIAGLLIVLMMLLPELNSLKDEL